MGSTRLMMQQVVRDGSYMTDIAAALEAVVTAIGGQERVGQLDMAQAVARAIETEEHLLVQAGTGTGKSMAYLVPAICHAIAGRPVVVATATLALQRQLMERDLPLAAAALTPLLGRAPTYAVLKGRNNYVCLDRLHRVDSDSARDDDDEEAALFAAPRSALGKQARAVQKWAMSTATGDRDEYPGSIDPRVWRSVAVTRRECVGEARCRFGGECFTALRREQVMQADIVVTNHAMLAIDALEGVPVLPEHDAVIIDEAHELVDRATQALTVDVGPRAVTLAAQRARPWIEREVHDALLAAADDLADVVQALTDDGVQRLPEPTRDLLLALTGVRDAARAAIGQIGSDDDPAEMAARQRAKGAMEEVHTTAGRVVTASSYDVVWVDAPRGGDTGTIHLAPLQVAGLLRDSLFSRSIAVLTSATLTVGGEFEPVARALGLAAGPDGVASGVAVNEFGDLDAEEVAEALARAGADAPTWRGLDVGSPFDYASQGILYVAAHLPPPTRDGIPEESLDEIGDLVTASGGRALVLCSSWRGVERTTDYLRVRCSGFEVLAQQRGDAVADLVDRFTADPTSVLVGTMSLWQGVDVPGSSCILVVIDKIPFPRPDDPVLSARQQAIDAAGGSGFRAVSVPRAGLLLAQGAGRLIRNENDRGVVAVLDPRLATASYARTLRASMPPLWYSTDKAAVTGALERLAPH